MLSLGLVLALSGCREEQTGTTPDSGTPLDGAVQTPDSVPASCKEATINQITSGVVKKDECVILKSVVVTAVDGYGSYTGDVYVQETTGGKGSGMLLYRPSRTDGKKVDDLKPGDLIKVEGKVKYWHPSAGEFDDKKCTTKKHKKELDRATLAFISSGTPPTPADITEKDLLDCTTGESYEHVLVRLKTARVNSVDASQDPPRVYLLGGAQIGNDMWNTATLKKDQCSDFTGVVIYFYGYRLHPRTSADVVTATGCATVQSYTIAELQDSSHANHPADGTQVRTTGVITAVDGTADSSSEYSGFWLQDEKGGAYGGIYIYYKWKDSYAASKKPKLNDKVELDGKYQLYSGLNEISYPTWTSKGQVTPPAPQKVAAADVATGGKEVSKWMGSVVEITSVTVGDTIKSGSYDVGFEESTSKLRFMNWLYDFMKPTPPSKGSSYAAVRGPLHLYYSKTMVLPRTSADLISK